MDGLWRLLRNPKTIRVAQIGIGLIFIGAGLAKLGDLRGFAEQIHKFDMVPVQIEHLMAMTLPWIEVIAGIGLILGVQARAGAQITAGLMVIFTIAVAVAYARGLEIECGCFGASDEPSTVGIGKLVQNTGMLILALIASLRREA